MHLKRDLNRLLLLTALAIISALILPRTNFFLTFVAMTTSFTLWRVNVKEPGIRRWQHFYLLIIPVVVALSSQLWLGLLSATLLALHKFWQDRQPHPEPPGANQLVPDPQPPGPQREVTND